MMIPVIHLREVKAVIKSHIAIKEYKQQKHKTLYNFHYLKDIAVATLKIYKIN